MPPPSTHPQIALAGGFDHCWVLDQEGSGCRRAVFPSERRAHGIRTNLPGLQVYGAYHLKTAYPGWHGVCLEPENFPDAPNHANFPSSILRPGADASVRS